MSVAINSPKTPVTKGSNGIAAATVPNICKMPGPPAPFVPAPLPNIGRSSLSPKGYSKKVKIKGKPVAIKGATFASQGDIASKATGGGMVSANTHGPTKFVGPGALDVKIEGKNVQLLSDPMLNNCGPSGNPPNSATLQGVVQPGGLIALWGDEPCPLCGGSHKQLGQIKETTITKAKCGDFTKLADQAITKIRQKRKKRIGMLGVVDCKDDKAFSGVSGWLPPELAQELNGSGLHYVGNPTITATEDEAGLTPIEQARLERLEAAAGASLAETFKSMKNRNEEYTGEWADEPFFPPGSCAGQQAMVCAIDHGARPRGMTERFYGTGQGERVKVFFRWRGPKAEPRPGNFGGAEAVPPCGTCQVIVTALMCNQLERNCDHGPKRCSEC